MKKSENDKVNKFMDDLASISSDKVEMIESIRMIFLEANQALTEEIKYGGLVFNLAKDLIGGIFPYTNHISIEFSYGVDFLDPAGKLEGKGKLRRHLKIIELEDIKAKDVEMFVGQAVNNKSA